LDLSRATAHFPLVGAAVGLFIGICFVLAGQLFPPMLAATLAATAGVLLTGAFHEDALGDVADGFGGGFTVERKLAIMKDSRQGTYGVLAIVLAMLVRIQAIALLPAAVAIQVLVATHALSRVGPVFLLRLLPTVRPEGIGASAAGLSWREPLAAASFGLGAGALSLLAAGPSGPAVNQLAAAAIATIRGHAPSVAVSVASGPLAFPPSLWLPAWVTALLLATAAAAAGTLLVGYLARSQIGGITGDVLGTCQQVCELLALLAIVLLV
ncbi:MAG: adenosylcobinamide-GDP ribazoletransferase, partial [Candidatus Sericytochromatia bacterium]|nr:adenosylcobinamide-GDP ribazoletransferase [Candidatus Tanganyikabacteria bacterium]